MQIECILPIKGGTLFHKGSPFDRLGADRAFLVYWIDLTLRHKFATDMLESGTNIKVLQSLLGHENLNTTEVYLSITDKDLYAAARRLDEHGNRAAKGKRQEKQDSGIQNVSAVHSSAINRGNGDPWTAALRVALEPANLCQALKPVGVEELQLVPLPVINKAAADHLRGLLQNDARHHKR